VAVEINTRYAYTVALKSKSQQAITDALRELINKMNEDKRTPTIFQSDNGSEFKNNSVSKLCEENNIQQFYCQENDKKCLAIAERFNRTIKALINKS
jgi:IS30 family transposase